MVVGPGDDGITQPAVDFRWAPSSVWTLICLPDDPHKTLVREDGALLYDFTAAAFDQWRFGRVLEFRAQTTHAPLTIRQWTEGPRRAIVHTELDYPRLTLHLTALAALCDGNRVDIVLWESVAKPDAGEMYSGLCIDAYLDNAVLAAVDTDQPYDVVYPVPSKPWPKVRKWVDDLPHFDSGAASGYKAPWSLRSIDHDLLGRSVTGFRPASGLLTRPVRARPGESIRGALVITLGRDETSDGDLSWATSVLDTQRRFWDELPLGDERISVPDREIQDLVIASARNMLQAREIKDGLPVLHVGPTIYRGLYLIDAHFMLEAARYLGHDDTADAGLDVLLRRVQADGSITEITDVPLIKETAVAVTTLVRQAELTGDIDMLREHWPIVCQALSFVQVLRDRARRLPPDHPFFGLVPEGFGDGGIGGVRAEYTTVAWMLIALKFAVNGATLVGDLTARQRLSKQFADLLSAFERSADDQRAISPDTNTPYLPVAPGSGEHQFTAGVPADQVPRWRQIQPETATWALAQAVWPGEVFGTGHRIGRDLLELFDERDDEEGIPATTGWLAWEAVWSYAASFAAHAWLYEGRPDKAIDYLYAFANHAAPTRVWREEQPLDGAGNLHICGDMPHNWASAEFIRLVRHMIVFERGESLELLPAIPEHWWQSGAQIRVTRTPTRFGAISIVTEATDDMVTIAIARDAREHHQAQVTARVMLPVGAKLDKPAHLRNDTSNNVTTLTLERSCDVVLRARR